MGKFNLNVVKFVFMTMYLSVEINSDPNYAKDG
jgi:hypothetical protein